MTSSPTIGFVIASHAHPAQLLRLVAALNRLYGTPPIACHHDFDQCALDRAAFPANVRFVAPSIRTSWGTWSVAAAFLAGIALLYAGGGPDWFVTLSAADYPAMDGAAVRARLAAAGCDAFVDIHPQDPAAVAAATLVGGYNPALVHLESEAQRRLKGSFYVGRQFWLPRLRRGTAWRLGRHTVRLPFASRFYPRHRLALFWGDAWFVGNRRVARVLMAPTALHRRLQRHLRWRTFPEESYFQTVLGNTAGLTLDRDNKRFSSWQGGAHPIALGERELDAVLGSGAFFARKFAPDAPVLDRLDAALAGTAAAA